MKASEGGPKSTGRASRSLGEAGEKQAAEPSLGGGLEDGEKLVGS